ncbi:MAG: Ada metal-binding domain-containing protein [Nitrospinota bacterium]|mgnify:FL=1
MKGFIFKNLIIVTSLLLFLASTSMAYEFWGSKNSSKYHYPDCKFAKKINPKNFIKFKTPEEAVKAGYIPCRVCKPPLSLKEK